MAHLLRLFGPVHLVFFFFKKSKLLQGQLESVLFIFNPSSHSFPNTGVSLSVLRSEQQTLPVFVHSIKQV